MKVFKAEFQVWLDGQLMGINVLWNEKNGVFFMENLDIFWYLISRQMVDTQAFSFLLGRRLLYT